MHVRMHVHVHVCMCDRDFSVWFCVYMRLLSTCCRYLLWELDTLDTMYVDGWQYLGQYYFVASSSSSSSALLSTISLELNNNLLLCNMYHSVFYYCMYR